MKRFILFFFSVALLFLSFACERHPASQTISGYEEKEVTPSKDASEKK